ncbi:hypothetical protein [Bradyrhizobium tropiciagri]|uniref:hypothetical protein n=1 Tax=Bradyrhizobium tropiciagri TaxID=312253 RepID=UPI00067CB493|nr:hypothetical protein [Bradyrhizobium tropiciagri]
MVPSDRGLSVAATYKGKDAAKQRRLRQLLRGHWDRETTDQEDIVRDSFDEALTRYQLYELAVENGYIPLTAIEREGREDLARLLWSEAARRYLRLYHYVTVAFLASRLELDIGFPCRPPPVREGNQAQFAFFLSQHQTWYQDVLLEGWLGFLDDYQVFSGRRSDKEIFQDFLKSDTETFEDQFVLWQLVAGAERFLLVLSDLYTTLSPSERPSYGSFYFYWMARFYGYRSTARGFKRDRREPDWSQVLLASKRIRALARSTLPTQRAERRYWMLLAKRNADCEKFWEATRQFLDEHQPPVASTTPSRRNPSSRARR